MSVSVDIVPLSDTLDMYGDADSSSAYSLSGFVSIAVASPFSFFERRRTTRILLHSVTLVFEGQNEVLTPQTGYSSTRLCSTKREIVPSEPIEMSNEGHEESDEPCVWNVTFNLPIPGWLPPSSMYGVENVGTRYTLFAEAKFSYICESLNSNTFSFATFCSPFRSRVKTTNVQKHIVLRRFICHSENVDVETGVPLQETVTYLVSASVFPNREKQPRFPPNVLKKVQVLASIPDHVDVERKALPFILRMRTKDLEPDECKRIQVTSVSANVIQKERYRTRVTPDYAQRYPIPPSSQQPPNVPLRDPHPIASIYDVGLGLYDGVCDNAVRSFSLLPPGVTGVHSLGKDNYPFADDADAMAEETWYTLESAVPIIDQAQGDKATEWAGTPHLRPSVSSPLVTVDHELAIELICTYDVPGTDEVASECLAFNIPLQFAYFATQPLMRYTTPPPAHSPVVPVHSGSQVPSLPSPMSYASSLPAYSQLFDSNGDRKIDYNIPLPLYSSSSLDLSTEGQESQSFLSSHE